LYSIPVPLCTTALVQDLVTKLALLAPFICNYASVSPVDSVSSAFISEMLFILILQQKQFVLGWTQLNTAYQCLWKRKGGIKLEGPWRTHFSCYSWQMELVSRKALPISKEIIVEFVRKILLNKMIFSKQGLGLI